MIMLILTRVLPLIMQNVVLVYPFESTMILSMIVSSGLFTHEVVIIKKVGIRRHFRDALNYLDFVGHLAGFFWVLLMYLMKLTCEEDDDDLLQCDWDEFTDPKFVNYMNLLWTFCITIRATDMFSAIN